MRLNKYLAKSGLASRRKSDELIKMATTTVNNEIILDPAYKVNENDEIRYDGRLLQIDQDKVVIMFNKPNNVFVATFIGSPPMNIINADVVKKENNIYFKIDEKLFIPCPESKQIKINND